MIDQIRTGQAALTIVTRCLVFLLLSSAVIGCGNQTPSQDVDPESANTVSQDERNKRLIAAAWANDVEVVVELVAEGADVNHQDSSRQSAYLIATSEGYLDLLDITLDNGADVASLDGYDGTGLIRAAERGHADVVERLLQTDIDVNHVNRLGWTALLEAIILGDGSDRYVRTVQLLLAVGANPNLASQQNNTSPLQHAQNRNQTRIVDLLIAAGAEP